MAMLPDDFWHYDEARQALSGKRSRRVFSLADPVTVRLEEARPVTGGMVFSLAGTPRTSGPRVARRAGKPGRKGRSGTAKPRVAPKGKARR
jgi:ribonuclease R